MREWRGAKIKMFSQHPTLPTILSNRAQLQESDSKWHGDEIPFNKEPDRTRVLFHNVNGLALTGTNGFDIFANEQAAINVDIQAISEHCLDTSKFGVTYTAKNILRTKLESTALLQLDSSTETAIHHYKPGGTGILLMGPTTSRLEPNGRGGDHMGRWSYIHLAERIPSRSQLYLLTKYVHARLTL